jgi:2-octaprenyl-6-methoxyphenol hydroxylase
MRYRSRVVRLVEEDSRVTGVVLQGEGGEETVRTRVVVGADGTSSAVRDAIGIELPRQSYDHSLFIVDVDRPAGYQDVLRVDLHADGGILAVPGVAGLALAIVVGRAPARLCRWGSPDDKVARVAHRSPLLAGRHASPVGVHLYKLWRGHAARYWARGAVLLGDAVHVINPVMAQGMTMAIEDAAALARHVGPALVGGAGPATLDRCFERYENERWPFNAAVIRRSHWISRAFALPGPFADAVKRWIFQLADSPPGRVVQQNLWSRFATSPLLEGA